MWGYISIKVLNVRKENFIMFWYIKKLFKKLRSSIFRSIQQIIQNIIFADKVVDSTTLRKLLEKPAKLDELFACITKQAFFLIIEEKEVKIDLLRSSKSYKKEVTLIIYTW